MLVTCAPSFVISLGWITVLTAGSMPHKQSCCLALSSTSATPVIAGACAEMHTLYAFASMNYSFPVIGRAWVASAYQCSSSCWKEMLLCIAALLQQT